jgi:hypothetical protein
MKWLVAPVALVVGSGALTARTARAADAKPAAATPSAAKPKPKDAAKPNDTPKSPDAKIAAPEAQAQPQEEIFGHHGQLNFRAEALTGYRMLFRYDKSPRCAPYDYAKGPADQQKFCGFGAAPGIGVALGFSMVDFFEPFVVARFGLADEADHTNQGKFVQVGVGARLYTMSDSRFKIFFSPFIGLDMTGGPVVPIGPGPHGSPGADDAATGKVTNDSFRTDILAHLDIGPQFDISRAFGVYVSGGLTFQMLRYLGATADLALGVQMRAP